MHQQIDDTTNPTIKSTKLDKETVEPGGQIHVQVEAEDFESGINTLYVKFRKVGGGTEKTVFLSYNEKTQRYEGTYNVPSDAGNAKWELFFIYASDNAGNKYSTLTDRERKELYQIFNIVKDIIPPNLPQVNEVNDKDKYITGTAETGSFITVKEGTTVLGTGTADIEGKYSVIIPNQKAGTKLTVTATDNAGNISEVKEVTVKDGTPPSTPLVNEVTEKSTSVIGTTEAGTTVTVEAGEKILGTTIVKENGTFSLIISLQKAGTKLTVIAMDDAGNTSEVREIIVKDITAPSISGATDKTVNINTTFDAKAGVTAKDNIDGDLTKVIKVTGTVNIKVKGTYTLTYNVTDKAGNVTTVTRKITVIDNVKPVISGATNKTIKLNSTFNAKAGVTAKDNVDGDLTKVIKVTGTVNTKKKGIYTLTYNVADKSNNKAVVNRKITVK
ncbi:Ig-like domain-containing protein [Priestia aryabhattai]|uniref:Ig-like domain-containing protein n=2 Tax=Priestia TaxID=2800373 RepID=UPI002E249B1E|nr:Ig-like domain-containing protein [Priestia aryabhattai]